MFDAYTVDNKPTIDEAYHYHKEQIAFFKEGQIDLINVVTLPTLSEALGVAMACDESGMEYTMGFILGADGYLLDGTSIIDAITKIDKAALNKPIGYSVTCTHPSVMRLLDNDSSEMERLIGFQANGSCLSPSELAKLERPVADDPNKFSEELKELKDKLDLKIIAGCCGTTHEHLCQIIKACQIDKRP